MNLVVKSLNDTADAGAEKLYSDALVNDGTLVLFDFSNRGMLKGFDVSKGITDLSEGTPVRSGVTTEPNIALADDATMPVLDSMKGLEMTYVTENTTQYTKGILVKGVQDYLNTAKPNTLVIFWLKWDSSVSGAGGTRFVRMAQDGGVNYGLTAYITPSGGKISLSIAGAVVQNKVITPNSVGATQIAIEYAGNGNVTKVYQNGVFTTNGASGGTWAPPVDDGNLAIGGVYASNAVPNGTTLYRFGIFDLDAGGESAADIVAKDYNYVNGIGEFTGKPTRRPYANLPVS